MQMSRTIETLIRERKITPETDLPCWQRLCPSRKTC
jgi:hypothetical protein